MTPAEHQGALTAYRSCEGFRSGQQLHNYSTGNKDERSQRGQGQGGTETPPGAARS